MSLDTSFTSYLLKANYGLEGDEVAEVAGNLGFIGKVGSMATVMFIGSAMDLFGRKSLTIGGLALAGTCEIVKPLFKDVTALYILAFLTDIGTVPALNSPFPVDYVEKKSLGLLSAGYFLIGSQLATFVSATGAI